MMHDSKDSSFITHHGSELPLVSIVMLTYNHDRYIERAISSIISQKFLGSFELIIGDDCSTDETGNIVRHFHDRYPGIIRLVTSEKNVGADANFKRCLRACKGKYIALCEGDDYWHDEYKLKMQIEFLDANPGIGGVHSDFKHLIQDNGRWLAMDRFHQQSRGPITTGYVFDYLLSENFVQTCTFVGLTSIFYDFLDDELSQKNYLVGDWPLYLYFAANCQIGYIDKSLAIYRRTPGSITNRGLNADIARVENSIEMFKHFHQRFSQNPDVLVTAITKAQRNIRRLAFLAANRIKLKQACEWLDENDRSFHRSTFTWLHKLIGANQLLNNWTAKLLRLRNRKREAAKYLPHDG